jgi:eukaryotic-like serine/threonine-protein kinase
MSGTHGTSGVAASPVPGYEILRTLSEGGMGRVYLARQHTLNRSVCVKVMSIPAGVDADSCRSRFCREAELLASVSHPHILSIFDFGATADQGLPYLVTEYIEGGDLRARMKAGEPMPISQCQSIVSQIGDALSHLHAKGILHRDLKPENILMPTDSLVKVGDFGIAVMRDKAGDLTESFLGLGTVGYVSPEQQYGLKVDERTDQYSLAALCYELLTGRRPLGSFAPPSQLNPTLRGKLDAVVLRGLAEESKNRFSSLGEYLQAFDRAIVSVSTRTRWPRLALVGLIAGLLVGAAWTIVLLLSPKNVVAKGGMPAVNAAIARVATSTKPPRAELPEPRQSEAKAPARSPEFQRLVELRSYAIWVGQGRPEGVAGEMVREKNWADAESQIENQIKCRAFTLWEQQGRPTGPAGEAASVKNMRMAERELLKETHDELLRHPLD